MSLIYTLALLLLWGFLINFLRYYVPERYSDYILAAGGLTAIEMDYALNGAALLPYLLPLYVVVCAARFYVSGGLIAFILSAGLLLLQTDLTIQHQAASGFINLFLALSIGTYSQRTRYNQLNRQRFDQQQYRQSKQLNIIREISNAFQRTLDVDQLQHVILTVITAGYGLGFNRALLFIVSEDGKVLEGTRGLGVIYAEEGIQNWVRIVSSNLRIQDLLNLNHESKAQDKPLWELVTDIKLPTWDAGCMTDALRKGKPVRYDRMDESDPLMKPFKERFHMTRFAVIPLITSQAPVGVIVVDNNINEEEITYEDLDAVIPIADQAASALQVALAYRKNEEQAITDNLTGLFNQRYFAELLPRQLQKQEPCCLMILDIDYFKHYNDTNGHLAGNDVLSRMAAILRSSIREQDIAFRFGGEEFAILFPALSLVEASLLCESIRSKIEECEFFNNHLQPGGVLTVSIGLAAYPQHRIDPQGLIDAADHAMYTAKRTGKNKVACFREGGFLNDLASC
jgi:diguanylate cyclase (GGDEF)-like protein